MQMQLPESVLKRRRWSSWVFSLYATHNKSQLRRARFCFRPSLMHCGASLGSDVEEPAKGGVRRCLLGRSQTSAINPPNKKKPGGGTGLRDRRCGVISLPGGLVPAYAAPGLVA